jgi:hypothetical protein
LAQGLEPVNPVDYKSGRDMASAEKSAASGAKHPTFDLTNSLRRDEQANRRTTLRQFPDPRLEAQ